MKKPNPTAATEALAERVAGLYERAKFGKRDEVWLALAGERELAMACARYVKNTSGWTFLHQAAYAGSEPAVRLLLRFGASLSAPSKEGETASAIARKRGHERLETLMLEGKKGRRRAVGTEAVGRPSSQSAPLGRLILGFITEPVRVLPTCSKRLTESP